MNRKNVNKWNMYQAVLKACSENSEAWKENPAFASAFEAFTERIDRLKQLMDVGETKSNPFTIEKAWDLDELISQTLRLSGNLRALGSARKNPYITAKATVSESTLKRVGVHKTLMQVQSIADLSEEHLEGLLEMGGWSAEDQEAFRTQLSDAFSRAERPRDMIRKRRDAKLKMQDLIRDTDDFLREQLDQLLLNLPEEHIGFRGTYKLSRAINDVRSGSGRSSGIVESETDSSPPSAGDEGSKDESSEGEAPSEGESFDEE